MIRKDEPTMIKKRNITTPTNFTPKKYHLKSPAQLYEEHKGVFHEKSTPEENVKGVGIDHFGILHQRNFERRANKNKY